MQLKPLLKLQKAKSDKKERRLKFKILGKKVTLPEKL